MKNLSWSALFLLGTVMAIPADQFHLTRTNASGTADMAYATVRLVNGATTTFEGKTDKFGRITVNMPNGEYDAAVIQGATKAKARLTIDGQKTLKEVEVK